MTVRCRTAADLHGSRRRCTRPARRSGAISSLGVAAVRRPGRAASAAGRRLTEISGAVIAPGQLVVESNVKKVQHPTGGVVGELRVARATGSRPATSLVRLDETQTRANLDIVIKALDELAARQARDEAERDGADKRHLPGRARWPRTRRSRRSRSSIDGRAAAVRSSRGRRARARRRSCASASPSSRQEIAGLDRAGRRPRTSEID